MSPLRLLLAIAFGLIADCRAPESEHDVHGARLDVPESWLVYDVVGPRNADPAPKPIVLVQGAQVGRELWRDEVERFTERFRVVRYDVRGFGDSGPESAAFRHHDDLLRLLDHLAIDAAHFVGLSLGGRIALDLCLEHPERVLSLTLAGPGISGWKWSDDGSWEEIRAACAAGDATAAAEAWLRHPYMAPAMEDDELAPRLRELALANAHVWLADDLELPLDPPAMDRLDEVRVPTRLLLGERDVEDIRRIVKLVAEEVPTAEVFVARDAGHVLNLERPEWFQEHVLQLVDSR